MTHSTAVSADRLRRHLDGRFASSRERARELAKDPRMAQEHGRLTATRSKAVIAAVNHLCGQIRPHAGTLTDAFSIPDEAIAAPIATGAEQSRQDEMRVSSQ